MFSYRKKHVSDLVALWRIPQRTGGKPGWRVLERYGVEGPYLTAAERTEIIRISKDVAKGRCVVIAGVGGPSTWMAEFNAKAAGDRSDRNCRLLP